MTSSTPLEFSDMAIHSTVQYIEGKTTLQAHITSSISSTSDKYGSPFDLLTSDYDKSTQSTYSTGPVQQTTKRTSPKTGEGSSTTSETFTSSMKHTTYPQTVTSIASLKTIPPREAVDATKTPTRMLGQFSQGLFQLTTRSVTELPYSSMTESTVSSVATDTSGLPVLLNVTSPMEKSTPSVSLTSNVVFTPTSVMQVPSTFSTSTSEQLQSSQSPQTTFKITYGKELTSILLHTSLLNETVSSLPKYTIHTGISGSPTSPLTSPSIHLSPALTRIFTMSTPTSTSIPDLYQTTKSVILTKMKEELSTSSRGVFTSEKALVTSASETTSSVSTAPSTISLTTVQMSSTLSDLTLPLQNTTSITDIGGTLGHLESTETPKPTIKSRTIDFTKTSVKPITLSTTNATLIQTPPVTLSTKKFPKSTEPSLKTLTTIKEHLGTRIPTQEAPTSKMESRLTDHKISTTHLFGASSAISPFTKPEGTIKVTIMPTIVSSTPLPTVSLFTTLLPSVTFDTSSHTYGKVTDSTTSYTTGIASTTHLETPAELTTKTATTEPSSILSTLGTINGTTLSVTAFNATTQTVYVTHSLMSTIKEKLSTLSVDSVKQSTMDITQPAYTSLVTNKTLTDSASTPLETLVPISNVTELSQLGTTLSIHTLSDSSVLPSTSESMSSETATELMRNLTASSDYYSFGTMVHTSSPSECMVSDIFHLDNTLI